MHWKRAYMQSFVWLMKNHHARFILQSKTSNTRYFFILSLSHIHFMRHSIFSFPNASGTQSQRSSVSHFLLALCLAGYFPIAALDIVNNDVDDASVNHKSNSRVLLCRIAFFRVGCCYSSAMLLSTHISSEQMYRDQWVAMKLKPQSDSPSIEMVNRLETFSEKENVSLRQSSFSYFRQKHQRKFYVLKVF